MEIIKEWIREFKYIFNYNKKLDNIVKSSIVDREETSRLVNDILKNKK